MYEIYFEISEFEFSKFYCTLIGLKYDNDSINSRLSCHLQSSLFSQQEEEEDLSTSPLQMRIPKAGAFFDSSVSQDSSEPESPEKTNKRSLTLKVSNGKIVR